ncbi:MAG: GPW/gp25 family protein [Rhodocyclaceae bacterium]|nr:GPW/gp25 family protein [Rhodocyclaceae bacterium]
MSALPSVHHWQPALGRDGFVEGLDDIRQAIAILLSTPRGSDPLRPDFGSRVWLYLDHPIDRARPHVVRETVEAIRRWEPRITITRVIVRLEDAAQMVITVHFKLASGVEVSAEVRPR